jgi:hypothetical protein
MEVRCKEMMLPMGLVTSPSSQSKMEKSRGSSRALNRECIRITQKYYCWIRLKSATAMSKATQCAHALRLIPHDMVHLRNRKSKVAKRLCRTEITKNGSVSAKIQGDGIIHRATPWPLPLQISGENDNEDALQHRIRERQTDLDFEVDNSVCHLQSM